MARLYRSKHSNPGKEKTIRFKLSLILLVMSLILVAIIIKLFYLQIIDSSDRYAAQMDQAVTEVELTASRGNILDRNGNILVQDGTAKSIYIVPLNVIKGESANVAKVLSEQLKLDYKKIYAKVTRLEDDYVEVKNGVSQSDWERLNSEFEEGFYFEAGKLFCVPAEIGSTSKAANALVSIFGMEKEDAEYYLTKKENAPIKIASKVQNELAEKIQKKICKYDQDGKIEDTNGLNMLDDHIRYYTNGNFMANVLGFTNDAYHGVAGIEASCDGLLSGENGVVLYQQDALGNNIPSQTKIIKEAKKGEDLKLSIDVGIQEIVETILKEAVDRWSAKSGTAIVMECKTAKVLAMGTYPSYDLSDPFTIPTEYASHHSSDFSGKDLGEKQNMMWKNPAVSFTYEPGSTFKAITASSALEEGVVSPDTTVYCDGSYNVDGITVHCTGYHGTQTVSEAVANSCNPGLIQIIQNLNPNTFYKYAYNFGYGKQTGIELSGEEEGILSRIINQNGEYQPINYATMSFGQGLATTPIQNLAGLNAVVNNGYYMMPSVLADDNAFKVHPNGELGCPKQVIAKQTSETMRNIMAQVVQNNPELVELSGEYPIGGKTGTAEQFVDGAYSSAYVTSFFCFAPVDDPQYTILFLLDGTDGNVTGSVSSAPYAIRIMTQLLNKSNQQGESGEKTGIVSQMKDLVGQNVDNAKIIMEQLGLNYRIVQQDAGNTVIAQSIPPGTDIQPGSEIELVVGTSEEAAEGKVTVPDLSGMSVQACNQILSGLSLNLKVNGSGFAAQQDIAPGTSVERNSAITVTFK